ncbi:unnamed protein product, partial [Staurois parvus]
PPPARHIVRWFSRSNRACAAPGVHSAVIGGAMCPSDTADHRSMERAEDVGSVIATCQCPSVPAVSTHQCHVPVPISATSISPCQCLPVHINAIYQCPSELPFSVTHQCQSVPPISANQCHLSVLPIS